MGLLARQQAILDKSKEILLTSQGSNNVEEAVNNLLSFLLDSQELVTDILDEEKVLILHAREQIETGCLLASLGLYRSAFVSVRLALEMTTGFIYFSANKLNFQEWLSTSKDIVWSQINDRENGIFSKRWILAFFGKNIADELATLTEYNNKASKLYRSLSEYVHGNYDTWILKSSNLVFDQRLFDQFSIFLQDFNLLIQVAFCIRFLSSFSDLQKDKLSTHLVDEVKILKAIRSELHIPIEDIIISLED